MPPYDPYPHLQWTEGRLIELERQVGFFVHGGIRQECAFTVDGVHLGHRFRHDPIPTGFSYRASELINHYRSALDHLVFELSTEAKGSPLTEQEARACYFPVTETGAMSVRDERAIQWLSSAAQDVIRAEQPHLQDGSSVLLLLHQLWNHNKHRAIQVAAGGVIHSIGAGHSSLWPGEVALSARTRDGDACPAKFTETVTVTFTEDSIATGFPLVRTIAYAGGLVRDIVDGVISIARTR